MNFLLIFILSIGFIVVAEDTQHHQKKYPINVPSIIDGKPFGINGHEIKKLLYIMKQVENLLHGTLNHQTNLRSGKYYFNGELCTIMMLAHIEKTKQLTDIEHKEMAQLLEISKDDFMKIAFPFVEQARSVKAMTLKFIDEWAALHGRQKSYMLDWSKEEDGKEVEAFTNNVRCFCDLVEFCSDLVSFISDLVQSCPHGWQQFLELQKKSHTK